MSLDAPVLLLARTTRGSNTNRSGSWQVEELPDHLGERETIIGAGRITDEQRDSCADLMQLRYQQAERGCVLPARDDSRTFAGNGPCEGRTRGAVGSCDEHHAPRERGLAALRHRGDGTRPRVAG